MEKPGKAGNNRFYDELYYHYPEDRRTAKRRAEAEPEFDYFEAVPPSKPKEAVGSYVKSHGFNVPLVRDRDEIGKMAADDIMLRSELAQDYNGLSGLFGSLRLRSDREYMPELAEFFHLACDGSEWEFVEHLYGLMESGLRNGELSPEGFMNLLRWDATEAALHEMLAGCGSRFDFGIGPHDRRASLWRFVEGTNVRIFADPCVEGRYHLGVKSTGGYDSDYPGPGYYRVEAGEHGRPQTFRKHRRPFTPGPCIETYEAIRRLEFFDATVAPVMELQIDTEGEIHFLQYLKTKLPVNYVEAFELPEGADATLFNNVRGATAEAGLETKLFFPGCGHLGVPGFIDKMEGRAVVYDPVALDSRFGGWLVQLLSEKVSALLHLAYVSFQDNHFDSAPVHRPPLAIGWANMGPDKDLPANGKLLEILHDRPDPQAGPDGRPQAIRYADVKITADGRRAAVESDWELKTAAVEDL